MTDFADFVVEMFESFGKVQAKKMFGGHGIFHDGLMIGLIADDELYLKADEQGAEKFKALGLGPFEYNKNGKVMAMSYYRAPEEVLERPDMATEWARDAYEAALRSHKPKKPKKTEDGEKDGIQASQKSDQESCQEGEIDSRKHQRFNAKRGETRATSTDARLSNHARYV